MKRDGVIVLQWKALGVLGTVLLLLGACSGGAPAATTDEILQHVNNSHTHWQTIQGSATIVWTGPNGDEQEYRQDFAVSQPASARFLSTHWAVAPHFDLWLSDGKDIYEANTASQTYKTNPLPAFAFDLSSLDPPTDAPDRMAAVHPFSMLIPSPIAQYIYPHWFTQQVLPQGAYTVQGVDEWLDRPVWLVKYASSDANSVAWIDQQTGVILRYESQGIVDFRMTAVRFDAPVAVELFSPPESYTGE